MEKDAIADCVFISQADRRTEKDAAGENTETDGRTAAAEELTDCGRTGAGSES
jgi:hypothetical protein